MSYSAGHKRSLSESSGSSGVGESVSTEEDQGQKQHQQHFYGASTSNSASNSGPPPFKIPKKTDLMGQGTFAGRRESREASTASSSASFVTSNSCSSSEDEDAASFHSPRSNNGFYAHHQNNATEVGPNDDAASVSSSSSSSGFSSVQTGPKIARADEKGEYSTAAMKMMSKMGYKEGKGLGKKGQGIVEPVGMSKQRGRRGLGLIIQGLEDEKVDWDPDKEYVEVKEIVEWMPEPADHESEPPDISTLRSWLGEGPRRLDISGEDKFCDPEVLSSVLKCKTVFDKLEKNELLKARTRSNPFETIKGAFFLNRAAMKMANMDAVFDFMFTRPVTPTGEKMLGPGNQLLYFADVCAGPGGFSEYVLWRKKWRARGFGFTLKGSHDFKLEDFFAGPPESFETHYGVSGKDGDGNVFNPDNIREFEKHVLSCTDGRGVHFMMADGGFTVEGQENEQEILSKQLYLCQFIVALGIVREHGHFVCKLFDVFTPFSVGLLYLMRRCFRQVCLHKPNTSRPANSERYVICKWKKADVKDVHDYFFEVNCRINQLGFDLLGKTKSETDVNEIVPLDMLMGDRDFYDYVVKSNDLMGERQVIGLAKIAAFCKDQTLHELRQGEIKSQCLDFWQVPNEARKAPPYEKPNSKLESLIAIANRNNTNHHRNHHHQSPLTQEFLTSAPTVLTPESLSSAIRSAYDFKFVLLGSDPEVAGCGPGFYLGMGRSKIFRLSSSRRGDQLFWEKVDEQKTKFELPSGTIIYAEQVNEVRGEGRSSRRVAAMHVIDAVFVGGEDLTRLGIKARAEIVHSLCRAMNKPTRTDYLRLRPKELLNLEHLSPVLNGMAARVLKTGGMRPRLTHPVISEADEDRSLPRYFVPTGMLLFRLVRDPYMISVSRSQGRKYWFNTVKRSSSFECPPDANQTFPMAFSSRLLWCWTSGFVRVRHDHEVQGRDEKHLQGQQFMNHVRKLVGPQ